jgi:hypothetical protein
MRTTSHRLATSTIFVPVYILHPFAMIAFLVLTATTFSLFGFLIGMMDTINGLQITF